MRLYLPPTHRDSRFAISASRFLWQEWQGQACPLLKPNPICPLHSYGAESRTASISHLGPISSKPLASTDHRKVGTEQNLWILHPSSPGSPIFTPEGTYIFQKLQAFLRAQYPAFGFQEVVTPTIYKQSLWEQSGHWQNYKDDMFTVTSGKHLHRYDMTHPQNNNGKTQPLKPNANDAEGMFGLKPMNCPGHCLLYASQRRSYNDLPIRYADFSPLHRDEISGALTGLTRVRRFHQDDGHIFCRPEQIQAEIRNSLDLMVIVYKALGIENYSFVLSTRPESEFIGTEEEWEHAEHQLKAALRQSKQQFDYNTGDGAFYGPKIDAIMRDSHNKTQQIGTIQLDFQLPKRFNLNYITPNSERAIGGGQNKGSDASADVRTKHNDGGIAYEAPVMIHRAILGSLERFMALLMETNGGKWPFWLHPRPMIALTVASNPHILNYAHEAVKKLSYPETEGSPKLPRPANAAHYKVDLDDSDETLAKKIALAKQKRYAIIVIIGQKNLTNQHLDVDVSNISDQVAVWTAIEKVKPGSQAPIQKDRGTGTRVGRKYPGVRLSVKELQDVMKAMADGCI